MGRKILKNRVGEKYTDHYFTLLDYTDATALFLNEQDSPMYHFATKEEIKEFKNRRKNYKAKRKEIDKLQEQITKLCKEL